MPHTTTVLGELLHLLPRTQFQAFVGQHHGDRYVKHFTCWNQLAVLIYAQLSRKISLREIETGLACWDSKLYHLGITAVKRNTLAHAMKKRNYHIFESLFYALVSQCRIFTPEDLHLDIDNPLYALDATVINVCLSLFPWAKFRKQKGAFKIHTLFSVTDQMPTFLVVTHGKVSDIRAAKEHAGLSALPKGSILTVDRGYVDYGFLHDVKEAEVTFVVRLKKNAQIVRLREHAPAMGEGILKDERIAFVLPDAVEDYPEDLRLVTYRDVEHDVVYEFLTNNTEFSAKTIADIYRHRWHVELFFKWIKQHLKIRTFLGTSKNAVLTQVWVAMICYLLLLWIKRQTRFPGSLTELTWMVSEVLLRDIPLLNILHLTEKTLPKAISSASPTQFSLL